jgi:dTDP-4-amino-4,6-dideoxygalactose transaminase
MEGVKNNPGTRARSDIDDLAVFGGEPAFDRPLHVGRPNIGDRAALHARIDEALDRRILSNGGPLVRELEERTATALGVRHAIAVTNATVGLQVAAKALDLQRHVIVPSFTFVATAHALDWIGLEPVFGDIEAERMTLDAEAIEPLIDGSTSAIVATHLWGRSADVEGLAALADRHDLRLIFDAAHAYGCVRDGRPVGGFGDAEVFSFHATKFVNAFEGGLISTNDDELAQRMRELRNFGFAGWDNTVSGGTNAKMHEVSAAMALTSLDHIDTILAVNRRNHRLYQEHLADVDGLLVTPPDERGDCNEQHVVVRVDSDAAMSRDLLQAVLNAENVLVRRYFYPGCHRLVPYSERSRQDRLPVTELVADEVLVLPTGTAIEPDDIAVISDLIRFSMRHAGAISTRSNTTSAGS